LSSLKEIPILSADEEAMLFESFQQREDINAARTLVVSHLRFVAYIARSYQGYGLPFQDIIQEGNVGLMKAVKKFDLSKGVRLISFAVHWIRAEIHEFILKNWRVVKVATTKAQRKLFFNLRKHKKARTWFTNEEAEMLSRDLGVKKSEVIEMEARLSAFDEELDKPWCEDDGGSSHFGEKLTLGNSENPEVIVERNVDACSRNRRMIKALGELDERAQDIIRSRWLADDKVPLKELGEKYQISLERVRQLEKKAMETLRLQLA
jgi:RNA polymerase sigma-32 factor